MQSLHRTKKRNRRWLRSFGRDARGFAGAEAALLALILCGICIVVGGILKKAALKAASSLNTELAGSK